MLNKTFDKQILIIFIWAVYTNTDENKIIEELEKYGINFKFAQDKEGYYYTLLSVKQEVLDRVKK